MDRRYKLIPIKCCNDCLLLYCQSRHYNLISHFFQNPSFLNKNPTTLLTNIFLAFKICAA